MVTNGELMIIGDGEGDVVIDELALCDSNCAFDAVVVIGVVIAVNLAVSLVPNKKCSCGFLLAVAAAFTDSLFVVWRRSSRGTAACGRRCCG